MGKQGECWKNIPQEATIFEINLANCGYTRKPGDCLKNIPWEAGCASCASCGGGVILAACLQNSLYTGAIGRIGVCVVAWTLFYRVVYLPCLDAWAFDGRLNLNSFLLHFELATLSCRLDFMQLRWSWLLERAMVVSSAGVEC